MSRHTENELCRGVFRLIETLQPGGTDIFAQSAVYAVGALAEMDASDDQLRMAAIYSHLWPLRGMEVNEELKTLAQQSELSDDSIRRLRFMNLDAVLLQLGLIDDAGFDQDEIADPERLTYEDMAATIMETFRFYLAYQESGDLDAALSQTKNEKLNQSLKKIAPLIQAVDA